ncbi:MAG: hypothetical protein HOH36_08575 [Acidimicrobiaceae bacterium]|jgi:hypothetical protein|nr:hypothetical protein [Acidimicrobiaceae bacterium]MBT5850473.1 hypothetical protein [Acidimicrobiaceae bacterium]
MSFRACGYGPPDGALRVLALVGIVGVRIRAVAREADVAMVEPDDTTGPACEAERVRLLWVN